MRICWTDLSLLLDRSRFASLFLFLVFTTDVSGGGPVVILPTDSYRGVPEYGRWQGYPFDFSLCTYVSVHKYEVILAWDVTASLFGFKTTPTSLFHLLNSARYDCLG